MATKPKNREEVELPSIFNNWEKEKPYGYSDDQLIDAFEIGKEKGRTDAQRILRNTLDNNLVRAAKATEKLAEMIRKGFEIEIQSMHLKINDLTSFSALIVTDRDTYFSEAMDGIYRMVGDYEKDLQDDNFKLVFRFTFAENDLNRDAIISDGYYLRYKKEEARRAQS